VATPSVTDYKKSIMYHLASSLKVGYVGLYPDCYEFSVDTNYGAQARFTLLVCGIKETTMAVV
jgi:hypothetical protein